MSNSVCLICYTPWVSENNEDAHFMDTTGTDSVDTDHTLDKPESSVVYMFQVFCQHMNVNLEVNPCQWNFPKEPLPFCPNCKEMVSYMFNLHNQLQNIQNELKSVVENVKFKIENSDENLEMTEVDKRISNFRHIFSKSAHNEDQRLQAGDSNSSKTHVSSKRRRIENQNSDSDPSNGSPAQADGLSENEELENTTKQTPNVHADPSAGKPSLETDESNFWEEDDYSDEEHTPGRARSKQSSQDNASGKPFRAVEKTDAGNFTYGGCEFAQVSDGFQCCICPNRIFKRKGGMLVHIRQVHLGERGAHTCEKCGRNCDSPYALKLHESTHGEEKNHICNECGKAFKNTKNLRRHLLETHKLNLRYACVHCKQRFKSKEDLDEHINTNHDSPAPKGFYCDCCGKLFNRAAKVKDHQKVHKKEKFFKCTYCGSNFLQKENLHLHFFKEHGIKIEGK